MHAMSFVHFSNELHPELCMAAIWQYLNLLLFVLGSPVLCLASQTDAERCSIFFSFLVSRQVAVQSDGLNPWP